MLPLHILKDSTFTVELEMDDSQILINLVSDYC